MPPLWSVSPSGGDLSIPLTASTARRKYESNQQRRKTFYTQGTPRFSFSTRFLGLEIEVGATAARPPAAYSDVCLSPLHRRERAEKQKHTFKVKGREQAGHVLAPRVRDRRPSRPVARSAMISSVNISDWT